MYLDNVSVIFVRTTFLPSRTGMDRWRKFIPWLGLASIVAAFVLAVFYLHPTNLFGLSEDDSIHFSSAKALAQGKGYVIASFPWEPDCDKIPDFLSMAPFVDLALESIIPFERHLRDSSECGFWRSLYSGCFSVFQTVRKFECGGSSGSDGSLRSQSSDRVL